jgi:hypothetical protein
MKTMIKVAITIEDGIPVIYSSENLDITVVDLDTDDPDRYEEALKALKEVEEDKDYTYSWSY